VFFVLFVFFVFRFFCVNSFPHSGILDKPVRIDYFIIAVWGGLAIAKPEIKPMEPDPDNTGVGIADKTLSIIGFGLRL